MRFLARRHRAFCLRRTAAPSRRSVHFFLAQLRTFLARTPSLGTPQYSVLGCASTPILLIAVAAWSQSFTSSSFTAYFPFLVIELGVLGVLFLSFPAVSYGLCWIGGIDASASKTWTGVALHAPSTVRRQSFYIVASVLTLLSAVQSGYARSGRRM